MPRPWELKNQFDLITADFAYVRWLGNRKGLEEQTTAVEGSSARQLTAEEERTVNEFRFGTH